MSIETNKTYKIRSAISSTRMLNLYSSGTAANGMNVVLYTSDDSNEQKWLFDGDRLRPKTDITFCLDRYTASTYLDNADIWKASAKDAAAQKIELEAHGIYYYIRLQTKVDGKDYYLTASNNTNGNATETGKQAGADGNVYWAEQLNDVGDYHQLWFFTEDSGSSSGGETGGSGDTYTINGKTIPLSDCPINTYWTTDGKPSDIDGTTSKYFNGKQCAGFARYVYAQIWGSDTKGTQLDTEKATLFPINGNSSDLSSFPIGSRLVCTVRQSFDPNSDKFDKTRTDSHQMIILKKTSSAVTVYHANWDEHCKIEIDEWNYTEFYNRFKKIKGASFIPPSAS